MSLVNGRCDQGTVSFNESIRPILVRHCLKCHGGLKQAGGISFVHREQFSGEGDSGRLTIVPGSPEESELFRRIVSHDVELRMPPADEGNAHGLSHAEKAVFRKWIEQGAEWENHWSLRAPAVVDPPAVRRTSWPRSKLDRFVLARMEEHGLEPAKEAKPEVWLRRASLDLTGLPPTLDELELFLSQREQLGERAYELAADRMLASPAFGERWASDWLDLARYADSKGMGRDGRRTIWKYRDWVIDAFNSDMPFDEFTIRQLAGDLLPGATMGDLIATAFHRNTQSNDEGGTDDEQFRVEAVIDRVNTTWQVWQGMTFECAQCHAHPYDPFSQEDYYRFMAFFNNTADSDSGNDDPLLKVPLAKADYSMARDLDRRMEELRENLWSGVDKLRRDSGVWKPLNSLQAKTRYGTRIEIEKTGGVDEFVLPAEVKQKTSIVLESPVPDGMSAITALRLTAKPRDPERALADSEWGFIVTRIKAEVVLPGEEGENRTIPLTRAYSDEPHPMYDPGESLRNGSFGFAAYTRMNYPREAVFLLDEPFSVSHGARIRVSMDHSVFLLASFTMVVRRGSVAVSDDERWTSLATDFRRKRWREELSRLQVERDSIPSVTTPVMRERPDWLRRPTHVFGRGDYLAKEKRVRPGAPAVLGRGDLRQPSDRLELARWLVAPENPLTARVTVNRYWQRMFGRGLAQTLEDVGGAGEEPTHPALLDDLAVRFCSNLGWSVKRLLREMALSSTYRQSAFVSAEKRGGDPGNRWLARGGRRRLTAEMVRDQALGVSGSLTRKLHGPPARPPIPEGAWEPFSEDPWVVETGEERYRRAIYTFVKRSLPYPMSDVFDAPSREFCSGQRRASNTPVQALMNLNDIVISESASGLARRMQEAAATPAARLALGYRIVTSRWIDAGRLADLEGLYAAMLNEFRAPSSGRMPESTPELSALNIVAGVLLNLDEAMIR